MPSQFLKPGLHEASTHAPPRQPGIPFGTEQLVPQPPQFRTSLPVLTSQPSAGSALQFSKPALQEPSLQTLATQLAPALAKPQRVPQPPHDFTSVARWTQAEAQQAA